MNASVTSLISAYVFDHKPDFETCWEKYDFAQLILVLEGSGSYKTDDTEYPLEADMMFYRLAHKPSSYVLEGENVRYALISFVCNSPEINDIGVSPVSLREEEVTALLDVIITTVKICEPLK